MGSGGGERGAPLGLGAGAFRNPGTLLPAGLRVELLPALVHERERAQRHPRQAPPCRARAPLRGVRRGPRRGGRPPSGPRRWSGSERSRRGARHRSPRPPGPSAEPRPIRAPRARPPTAGGRASSMPPCAISASTSTRRPVEPPRSRGHRGHHLRSSPWARQANRGRRDPPLRRSPSPGGRRLRVGQPLCADRSRHLRDLAGALRRMRRRMGRGRRPISRMPSPIPGARHRFGSAIRVHLPGSAR